MQMIYTDVRKVYVEAEGRNAHHGHELVHDFAAVLADVLLALQWRSKKEKSTCTNCFTRNSHVRRPVCALTREDMAGPSRSH